MLLEISFAEINKLVAAKGQSRFTLGGDGANLVLSIKILLGTARLRLRQIETSLNRVVFSHKGDNLLGSSISMGGGLASFFKIPDFVSIDTKHVNIYWDKLLPQISIHSSRISVKGSSLLVDLEI